MQLTDFHAKYFAHELTRRYSSDRVEKLATVLADAQVDLVRILKESNRLPELFNNSQRFMDSVASILKQELHRLLVDGVKYERIDSVHGADWEMVLFKNEKLINYLTALQVSKSVYEYVSYDSQIEREFAKRLDEREDIQLFVKLPRWFEIDTPVGKYNPDWAILKHDGHALYLARETKEPATS
jgi:type III restriction enzyme